MIRKLWRRLLGKVEGPVVEQRDEIIPQAPVAGESEESDWHEDTLVSAAEKLRGAK